MTFHLEAVKHVVKRSAQALESDPSLSNPDRPDLPDFSKAGLIFILLTIVVFAVGISLIRYTLWAVIGELAMVEQPQTSVIIDGYKDNTNKSASPDGLVVEEAVVLNEVPITSKIRTTIRYLHRRAGWKARYRGLALSIVYSIVAGVLMQLLLGIFGVDMSTLEKQDFMGWSFIANLLATVITTLALARWAVTWTHIVISEPSAKTWFRRIPPMNTFKKVAAPTIIGNLVSALNTLVPALVFVSMLPAEPDLDGKGAGALITAFSVWILLGVFLTIPCNIAITRVYASLLPAEEEAIVPFDRTFGGKVVPEALGGTGVLSFADAFRTIDAEARNRMIKLFAKFILIDIGLHFVFALAVVSEAVFFLGPHLKDLLQYYKETRAQ